MKQNSKLPGKHSSNTLVVGIPERIIKFRAWDDGKMVYQTGALVDLRRFFRVIREDAILMQFTGEKDERGNDIYEGDIFQPFSEGVLFYVVKFEKG
ncbi:MAG: YopX family protein, partial [Salegentibacter mishustinae]|nr:YopX family protein [Salegentibacter mishustinae]